jgi:hypothetical protein
VPEGTPPLADARRDVGRIGRLHWLTGRRSAAENWDAYEAPDGRPLLDSTASGPAWHAASAWLMDVATELAAAEADGSMPALGLDRIWIRHDGHTVLLDFPAPGASRPRARREPIRAGAADDTPVALLAAIAARVLASPAGDARGPQPMPLSAAVLLERWSRGGISSPETARAELAAVLGAPDRVLRRRRAVPILVAAAPATVLIVGALAVLPQFRAAVTEERIEVYSLLDALDAGPGAPNAPADPGERRAIEKYLAGRHRALLIDDRVWSSPIMQGRLRRSREVAARVAAAHPSVSADELAAATAAIAPSLERFKARYASSVAPSLPRVDALIVLSLMGVGLGTSLVGCVISAALVPGGALMRLLGLAVVARDGTEIGRGRSIVRALVAWSPVILWGIWIGPSPIDRTLSAPASPAMGAGIVLAVLAGGAAWSILEAPRGPVSRLTGTWLVPR